MRNNEIENLAAVTRVQLANLFGCNETTIDKYRKLGLPTQGTRNQLRYPLSACIQWLVSYKIEQEREKERPATIEPKEEAVLRKLTADALMKEAELALMCGELVNVADVERALARYAGIVRNALLTFPIRTAPFLVQVSEESTMRELLQSYIEQLMTSIAQQANAENDNDEESEADSDPDD